MRKKLKTIIATIAIATAIVAGAPQVAGASTSYGWSVTAERPGALLFSTAKSKTTDTSVLVKYSKGSSDYIRVFVYASPTPSSTTFYDVTYPSTKMYIAYKTNDFDLEVMNLSHERYGDTKAKLEITITSGGTHSGSWIPDIGK